MTSIPILPQPSLRQNLSQWAQRLFTRSDPPRTRSDLHHLAQRPAQLPPFVRQSPVAMRYLRLLSPLAWGQFVFLLLAFAVLTRAFLVDDFSVLYVAQHGNTQLPDVYKISAVWGAHEGSLLLWGRIVRDVGAFLSTVWAQGALFGTTPEQAYYVKCDAELNPPATRDLGQLFIEIGLCPVKPAEFVIFRISQWTAPG